MKTGKIVKPIAFFSTFYRKKLIENNVLTFSLSNPKGFFDSISDWEMNDFVTCQFVTIYKSL